LAPLEREGSEEVLAHDAVLKLRRLAQQVDQRLAVLDDKRASGEASPPREAMNSASLPRPAGAVFSLASNISLVLHSPQADPMRTHRRLRPGSRRAGGLA
jgi:hypothetical protein